MDSHPPKRRRTSPIAALPVPDPQNQSPTRASFMSPTRASLSRFNPSLLPVTRARSAQPSPSANRTPAPMSDLRSDLLARGEAALNYIMGGLSTPAAAPSGTPLITGEETDEQMEAMRAANASRRESERLERERRSLPAPEVGRGAGNMPDVSMEDAIQHLDEDDLPETPEAVRRQLEVEDTPPRGILFSSPSKRKKRSPLKKAVATREAQATAAVVDVDSSPVNETQAQPKASIAPKDPETVAKEEEKARLQKELESLRNEVRQYEVHIDELEDGSDDQNLSGDLLAIITSKPDKAIPPPPPLSSLLTAFLPFSVPLSTPTVSPLKDVIPSHAPLVETDPLPLLSLFTPLTMNSTINAPTKPRSSNDPTTQKHNITLSGPASLLTCNLELTIASYPSSPGNPTVQNLSILQLSPWARREAGEWLEKRAEETDVAAFGFALGRYWDVSTTRAQCWTKCCQKLGHLVTCASDEDSQAAKAQLSKQKRGKTPQRDDDVRMADDESTEVKLSKKDLLNHLGRKAIVLENEEVILRINWDINFDWTGEVESAISAKAEFISSWVEADTQGSLKKIPATFDMLVQERGVFAAIEIITGLVFPS